MRFKQLFKNNRVRLNEGGNVELKDEFGKVTEAAEKIDLTKATPKEFEDLKQGMVKSFDAINTKFDKQYGYPLWSDFNGLVKSGKIFSGSTRAFFTKPFKTFAKFKPLVGDMDIQVPESSMKDLRLFLDENAGKKFGEYTWVGYTANGMQFNGLLRPPKHLRHLSNYIQLDFEGTEFKGENPTEFATFGHYSSWEDITKNVKGLFIKYLMRALSSGIEKKEIAVISPKTGKRLKRAKVMSFYGFSVDKGFRLKLEPVLDDSGDMLMTDGLPTYTEIDSKKATYKTDLSEIFSIIFGVIPTAKEKKDLFSFIRTLPLIKKYVTMDKVEDIHDQFVRLLWGRGSQGIERKNPEGDLEIKMTAYNEFLKVFPQFKSKQAAVEKMIKEFMSTYKMY